MADEERTGSCAFVWEDGNGLHDCRKDGAHEVHKCTCGSWWPIGAEPFFSGKYEETHHLGGGPKPAWRDGTCAACGRLVRVWEGRDQGVQRRVIIDPEPSDDGDTIIQPAGTPVGVIREDVAGRFTLYRSHFWTCPKHLVEAR